MVTVLVDTDKVVTKVDIARMAGTHRTAVFNWIERFPDFPKPIYRFGQVDIFDKKEVETWLADREATKLNFAQRKIRRLEAELEKLKREREDGSQSD